VEMATVKSNEQSTD